MPPPVTIVTEIDLPALPAAVWPHLVDWERLGEWMREASDFRVLGEQREGVGVEAEATVRIGGIRTRDRIRVTRWEPPTILEMDHLGWVRGRGYMELNPTDEGTHVFWREELWPPLGIVGRLGLRVYSPLLRRVFRRDLRLLRAAVERDA